MTTPMSLQAWSYFSSLSDTTVVAIFQIFVYGDVVYAQTWEVLTLKNCIKRPEHHPVGDEELARRREILDRSTVIFSKIEYKYKDEFTISA